MLRKLTMTFAASVVALSAAANAATYNYLATSTSNLSALTPGQSVEVNLFITESPADDGVSAIFANGGLATAEVSVLRLGDPSPDAAIINGFVLNAIDFNDPLGSYEETVTSTSAHIIASADTAESENDTGALGSVDGGIRYIRIGVLQLTAPASGSSQFSVFDDGTELATVAFGTPPADPVFYDSLLTGTSFTLTTIPEPASFLAAAALFPLLRRRR